VAVTVGLAIAVVAFGILVGVVSALFGVGGGIVILPFMVLALSTSQHVAEGTSLLVIIPTSLVGFLAHRRERYGSVRHAALLGLGGMIGSFTGATIALSLSTVILQRFFGVLVIVAGVRLLLRGRGLRGV
jgi:uncharacterized membrane protein YfcA